MHPLKEYGFLFFLSFCLEKIPRKVVPWCRDIVVKVLLRKYYPGVVICQIDGGRI